MGTAARLSPFGVKTGSVPEVRTGRRGELRVSKGTECLGNGRGWTTVYGDFSKACEMVTLFEAVCDHKKLLLQYLNRPLKQR